MTNAETTIKYLKEKLTDEAIKFLQDKHIIVEEQETFYRIRTLRGGGWHFSMGEMEAIRKLGEIKLIEVNQQGKFEGLVVTVDKEAQ